MYRSSHGGPGAMAGPRPPEASQAAVFQFFLSSELNLQARRAWPAQEGWAGGQGGREGGADRPT